jgi:hypothetical protein
MVEVSMGRQQRVPRPRLHSQVFFFFFFLSSAMGAPITHTDFLQGSSVVVYGPVENSMSTIAHTVLYELGDGATQNVAALTFN